MESRKRIKAFVCALAIAIACGAIQNIVFATQGGEADGSPSAVIDAINAGLAGAGKNVRVDQAELFVHAAKWDGSSTTIIANDRQHRLSSQFVERDPRRSGFADISYLVDQSDGAAFGIENGAVVAVTNAQTEAAIDRSMLRWQNQPGCPGPAAYVSAFPDLTGSDIASFCSMWANGQ